VPPVPSATSVFSNVQLTPEQLAWLAEQFGGQRSPDDNEFNIELGSGIMDAVGLADGTEDIKSMPYQITQDAARWLGGPPTYRLSIMAGDSQQCRDLAWRIANEFARHWPAVLSDHTATPVIPLGELAKGQARQASQQGQKWGWRQCFGG
jgi:hypothetical protein